MADGRPENPRNREGRHGRRTRGRAEGVTRLAVETSIAPQSSRSDCVASKTWGNSLSSGPGSTAQAFVMRPPSTPPFILPGNNVLSVPR